MSDRQPNHSQRDLTIETTFEAGSLMIRCPRTGTYNFSLKTPSSAELYHESTRIRDAQPTWAAAPVADRAAALSDWGDTLRESREDLIQALIADTGRYTESALEVDLCIRSLARWAQVAEELSATPIERPAMIPMIHLEQRRIPYPVVGVISPWNFPLLLALIDTIPALLAGCAVLLKPSEITPRFIEVIQRTISQVPTLNQVITVISGGAEVGRFVVQLSDYICFTGSVTTGRRVAEACAARFIPASLELGGKDPAIVLEGADVERASAALCWGGMVNAGQSCLSIERVYAHQSLYDDLTQQLAKQARALRLNDQDLYKGEIGPIIAARQAEVIRDHLNDAFAQGARALCGGEVVERDGGLYCLPTILIDVNENMRVMTEETFGPILPVMSFTQEAEAIRLANASDFGLSGAVFGAHETSALRVARQLIGGAISVQDAALTSMVHEAEKHAFKLSGLGGSRMGAAALSRFTRSQALIINRNSNPNPWWF